MFGRNIKKYRLLLIKNGKHMTQEQLAEEVNVSVSLISSLESSKVKKGISIPTLYRISIVLNTPINKFFEDKNE